MKRMSLWLTGLVILTGGVLHSQPSTSTSNEHFVSVQPDVKLQVLDWGGTGRPLIFLSGLGDDAHVYDKFAPKFTEKYHVYAITRRGFGASSKPAPTNENYNADRLGDDVLAVIDELKLDRPVLVGHSIAGEELSSVGSRHPEKISGLIYLEAGMGYAYYDAGAGWIVLDMLDLKRKLQQFEDGAIQDEKHFLRYTLAATQQFEKDLQQMTKEMPKVPAPPTPPPPPRRPAIPAAIQFGEQKYTKIDAPILAIFAIPHDLGQRFKDYPAAKAAITEADRARFSAQANAFVTLHSNQGRATLILQRFPLFKCKAIALKSRTFVVKPRTKFAAKIVRDLSAKVATIRDSVRDRLGRKPVSTLPSDTGSMRFPLPSTLSAF